MLYGVVRNNIHLDLIAPQRYFNFKRSLKLSLLKPKERQLLSRRSDNDLM